MVDLGFLSVSSAKDKFVTQRECTDAARIIGIAAMNMEFMAPAVRTMYQQIIDKYKSL